MKNARFLNFITLNTLNMDTVKKIVWVTVDENLGFSDFENREHALSKNHIAIFQEREGSWVNGSYTNYAYDAHFMNISGDKIDSIVMNNWRLIGPKIYAGDFYAKEIIYFDIMDPKGMCKDFMTGKSRNGIRSGILLFKKFSQFDSWMQYEKSKENPTIINPDTQDLNDQIQQLKAENTRLKEKLGAIRRVLEE